MATIPTPKESGRKILQLYKDGNLRPGEMMVIQAINTRLIEMNERPSDISDGLKWLISAGYLEQRAGKPETAYFITESGFAEL